MVAPGSGGNQASSYPHSAQHGRLLSLTTHTSSEGPGQFIALNETIPAN